MQSIKWSHRMLWADLVLYVVFLLTYLLAALAPFVSVAWDGHMLINVFSKYANTLEWPDPSNTFKEIHSVADFWSWWRGPFRCALSQQHRCSFTSVWHTATNLAHVNVKSSATCRPTWPVCLEHFTVKRATKVAPKEHSASHAPNKIPSFSRIPAGQLWTIAASCRHARPQS